MHSRKALALGASLSACLLARTLPSQAAVPSDASADRASPITPQTMLNLFLADNPAARTDVAFVRDWVVVTKCTAWTGIRDDEFRADPFLKAGAVEFAANRGAAAAIYDLRLDRNLDRYDAGKGEFGLRTIGADDVLPIRIDGYRGEAPTANAFRPGCAPTSGGYPLEFQVTFDNPQVADGLPMRPDAAAAFAQSRTNQLGSRDTRVSVDLKVRLTLGKARPVAPRSGASGLIVPVTAHVEDVVVEDETAQHRTIYRLDDAKRHAGEEAAARHGEEVAIEGAAKPLDGPAVEELFEMERAQPKVGTQPYRVGLPVAWARQASPNGQTYALPLKPSDVFRPASGISLRFDNAAEVAALAPTPEIVAAVEKGFQPVSVTFVPVGASDDALKGGRTVVGHVLSVEVEDRSTGVRKIFQVRTTSVPAPWKAPEADVRLAAAFDILGIRTGMAPAEVAAIASRELGRTAAFDEAKGEVRSPQADCDIEFRRNGPPALGRRCYVGTFVRSGSAGTWVLARNRLTQTIAEDQMSKTGEALVAKYGKPDLTGRFDPPPSSFDLEGTIPVFGQAINWGARLTNVRPEADNVPFPLHAMEMRAKISQGVAVITLTATDQVATTAAADTAAAAAGRAGASVAPKF